VDSKCREIEVGGRCSSQRCDNRAESCKWIGRNRLRPCFWDNFDLDMGPKCNSDQTTFTQ
jgi:hypothetical protein